MTDFNRVPQPTSPSMTSFFGTVIISLVMAVLCIPVVIAKILIGGPAKFLMKKNLPPKPECLSDKDLGIHQTIKLKDVTLHCVSSGPKGKPLMLFLHGFPEMWYSWRHQIREFSQDYRTVALDLRGYGESSKPKGLHNYRIDCMVNDISELIHTLGYKSCILVAHDWGGKIANYFSAYYPEMIDRLILFNNPHPDVFDKVLRSSFRQILKSWYTFFFQIPFLPEWILLSEDLTFLEKTHSSKAYSNSNLIENQTIKSYKYALSIPGALTSALNYYRARSFYKFDELPKPLPVSTLFMWGVHDLALSPEMAILSKPYYKTCDLKLFDDAGHWLHQERYQKANQAIREFLSCDAK